MRVVVDTRDRLTGCLAWALELLGELNVVADGLLDGTMSDEEALRRIDEVVDEKHGPPRFVLTVVNTNAPPEPPDPTRLDLSEYAHLLAAFLGGIRGHVGSIGWLVSFLERASVNQAVTIIGYLRALQEEFQSFSVPREAEFQYWRDRLRSGDVVTQDRGPDLLRRYRSLPRRGD